MIKPPANLTVYKASAGSGKTFTLATEYIALLVSNPYQYENILAVTFTNKATEEMKMRIVSQLYGISRRLDDSKPYLSAIKGMTGLPENIIVNNADTALHLLLHNYNRFRVQTIDSFFQMVFRNLARELELTPNLKIEIRDEEIGEKAVDELIERLDEKSQVLRWIRSFISQKIADNKSWNVISLLKSFGKNIFKDYYKEHSDELDSLMADDKFTENYIKALRQIVRSYDENIRQRADKIIDCFREHGLDDIELFSYKRTGLLAYIYKVASGNFDGTPTSPRIQSFVDDPTKWPAKKCGREDEIIQLAQQRLHTELVELEQARCNGWPLCQSARLVMDNISQLRLLHAIASTVDEINKDKNRFQLSNTQTLLHSLIKDSDSPFVFEKTGANLRHIMIDEFQDTSTTQWKNFSVLLQETISRQDSENVIVGDVKQSIYRWRSGDWRLLNNIEQQFSPEVLHTETLKTNRRSERHIIAFNNAFFTEAARLEYSLVTDNPEAQQLQKAYADVEQLIPADKPASGYVSVQLLTADDYQQHTLELLSDTVKALSDSNIPQNRIAILVRTNSYIPIIANYFAEHCPDFSIVSDEAFRLDASRPVNIIIETLRLLAHPDDPMAQAFLDKALSEPVGIDEAKRQGYLSLPLYELVEQLFADFHLDTFDEQSAYLCAFFDQLNSYITENAATIDDFLREWEESIRQKTIQSDITDGIRIISIHKSKGLEYDHVLVPFCDWQLEKTGNVLWCRPDEPPFSDLPIAPVDYSQKGMTGTIYEDDYHHEHLQNVVDNLNLLYVAFTRARRSLYVIGKRGAKNSRSEIIEQTLPNIPGTLSGAEDEGLPLTYEYGTPVEATANGGDVAAGKQRQVKNVFLTPADAINVRITSGKSKAEFRQSNKSREFISGNDEMKSATDYIQLGSILHHVFSTIHTYADVDGALQQLEADGVLYDGNLSTDRITAMLRKRLDNQQVADWFSGRWRLFNECTILSMVDGQVVERRPDRVMTDGTNWIVVDFKFGRPDAGHHQQVRQYMELLRAMGHRHVQGFLWYVYSNKIEVVAES